MSLLVNGLHPKLRCVQFPWMENLMDRIQRGQEELCDIVTEFYEKVHEMSDKGVVKNTLSFRKWKNLSQINMTRMSNIHKLIATMLEPHPYNRSSLLKLF